MDDQTTRKDLDMPPPMREAQLRSAMERALEKLKSSLFTNSEHSQAIHILEKALRDKRTSD